MLKRILLAVGALGLLLLLGYGGIVAGFAAGRFQAPTVVGMETAWGEIAERTTELRVTMKVHNPNPLPLFPNRVRLEYRLAMNGILLAEGAAHRVVLPRGTSSVQVSSWLDNSRLQLWWATHLQSKERTSLAITPRIRMSLGPLHRERVGRPVTSAFHTDLLAQLNSSIPQDIPFGEGKLVLRSTVASWGIISPSYSRMYGRASVYNPTSTPLLISGFSYTLTFNSILIAQGQVPQRSLLQAEEVSVVPLAFDFPHQPILKWWASHLQNHERTAVELVVRARIEADGQQLPIVLWAHRSNFETDMLGSKRTASSSSVPEGGLQALGKPILQR